MKAETELNMQVMHLIDIILEEATKNIESIQECIADSLKVNTKMTSKDFISIIEAYNNNLIKITNQMSLHLRNMDSDYYDVSHILDGLYSDKKSMCN